MNLFKTKIERYKNIDNYDMVKVFFINDNNELLLFRDKSKMEFWHLWFTYIKKNEISESVILHKIFEELKMLIQKEALKELRREKVMEGNNFCNAYFYYIKVDLNQKEILKNDLLGIKWFKIDELLKLAQYKNNNIEFNKNTVYLLKEIRKISNNYNKNFI